VPLPPDPTQRLPRYLTQAETRAFFDAIGKFRDLTLFSLIYLYGLRVSEATLLERGDVDLERSRLVVKRVKGGVWAERPLFEAVESLLRLHLAGTHNHADAPLFAGRRGALKKRQIQTLFARYRDRAGLSPRYTAHSLRHSIATHLLDAGATLEFVQDHLGHQSIRSTSIYARITDRHRAALFKKLEASPWIVQPGG
jgi:site-specific recombinase XerD